MAMGRLYFSLTKYVTIGEHEHLILTDIFRKLLITSPATRPRASEQPRKSLYQETSLLPYRPTNSIREGYTIPKTLLVTHNSDPTMHFATAPTSLFNKASIEISAGSTAITDDVGLVLMMWNTKETDAAVFAYNASGDLVMICHHVKSAPPRESRMKWIGLARTYSRC
jgi:hypothetical protein